MNFGRCLAAFLLFSAFVAVAGACSSGDDDNERAQTTTTDDGDAITPTAVDGDEETPTPSDDEGDGEDGSAPTFPDGVWTGGDAEIAVTSATQVRLLSGTLSTESETEPGTTRLIYTAGLDTIFFSISTEYEPFAVTVYKESDGFDAGSAFEQPCEVTYQSAEDNRIEATFSCENVDIDSFNHQSEAPASFEGRLLATR